MSHKGEIKKVLDLGQLGEVECLIEYDFSPGDPGCHTMRNGDPGWPPTGADIDITCITTVSGVDITKLFDGKDKSNIEDDIVAHEEVEKLSALCDASDAANDEKKLREWHDHQEMRCDD